MRALVLAGSLLVATAASAQPSGGPARNGNVYNGTAHQPTQGQVETRERGAGIAAGSPDASGPNTDEVNRLNQQLLHDEAVDPPNNPNRPVAQEPAAPRN